MVDEIASLLEGSASAGYRRGMDAASDAVLERLVGETSPDACAALAGLASAPSLAPFSGLFDGRVSPVRTDRAFTRLVSSETRHDVLTDVQARLAGSDMSALVSHVFMVGEHATGHVRSALARLASIAALADAALALGAIALACALRRRELSCGRRL